MTTAGERDQRFRSAVVDGGALGAAAIDLVTRAVTAGFAHDDLASPGLLDLLLGSVPPSGPLTRACGGPPPAAAREFYVAGRDRALYCTVQHGELILLATPAAMSVALGWTLARGLAATGTPR